MIEFHLSHWRNHRQSEDLIIVVAADIEDLRSKLAERFPEERDILIHKHGFNYITFQSHVLAAGFPVQNPSIADNLAPAHFNPNFFYILKDRDIK